jgi:hypothetical protein
MKRVLQFLLGIIFFGCAVGRAETDLPSLDEHLEVLRPLLGKTFKGQLSNSKPDQPLIDVQRWERALNGKAVRAQHSINNGVYGGETIFRWDSKKNSVVYYYFTTEGFTTIGTVKFEQGKIVTHEDVSGDQSGITEVRATSEFLPNGGLHVKAEYLKNGSWVPGHEVTYAPDATASVLYK